MSSSREQMAAQAARELRDGYYVNLGIGIPTLVSNYIPKSMRSENGMLGISPFRVEGEEDADLINTGKQTIIELLTTSYFLSAKSFAMIRGGHNDLSTVSAMKVSENSGLANWMIPNKMVNRMGGAMDPIAGVVVAPEQVAEAKYRSIEPKLLTACCLRLTGRRVVDTIVIDSSAFAIDKIRGKNSSELSLKLDAAA
jgi:3-oxoacid CoA-transferase subunit B